MDVISLNKMIAQAAYSVFGGKPKVTKFWDDPHKSSVELLSCIDRPRQGVTSYSTIGLFAHEIGFTSSSGTTIRVELVGVSASIYPYFPNMLATCAFNIINSKFTCYPGAIFRDVVSIYDKNTEMKHMLFVAPFVWEEPLKTIHADQFEIAWLLGVPISSAEYEFATRNSADKLESMFEDAQVDLFDLRRSSVL